MRWAQRAAFLLLAAVMALGAARLPTSPRRDTADGVYVYEGYAAATDAPWDEKSLELAAHRFQHLIETYFGGSGYRFCLSVVPDKAQFTRPPEGYVPADASETADWLAARLPVQAVDIASLLTLEDYYRTDPHWRQETLLPVAQRLAEALHVTLPEDREETLCALAGEFHGSYWGKTKETLAADTRYLQLCTAQGGWELSQRLRSRFGVAAPVLRVPEGADIVLCFDDAAETYAARGVVLPLGAASLRVTYGDERAEKCGGEPEQLLAAWYASLALRAEEICVKRVAWDQSANIGVER